MDNDPKSNSPEPSGFASLWAELKRRHVVRVATVYAVVGWLVIQVASATFSDFGIPLWAYRFVVLMVVLGFPISLVVAWAFELTPKGIKTTKVAQEQQEDSPPPLAFTRKRKWLTFAFGAVLPTLIFGSLAAFFYLRSGSGEDGSLPSGSGASANVAERSVAVLPFASMSGDAENEYFSDGISEELLNVLAKVPHLRVPARTSSFFFKGKNMPVQEIGQALKVEYVLEGSVRKAGEQVRITAQLIKVNDGYHLWSDTFTRDLKDIFALQDEIAGLIAKQLQLELGVAPKSREVDPEAHRLLLEAKYYLNQRSLENFERAAVLLNQSLEIDPDFAEAHSAFAYLWVLQAVYSEFQGVNDVSSELENLRVSVERALELDPSQIDPYSAMAFGLLIEGRTEESGEWFDKAFAISPDNPTARHWHALFLMAKGEPLAGRGEMEKARRYDPMSFIIAVNCARFASLLGINMEALQNANRSISLRPGGSIASDGTKARTLWRMGRKAEAIEIARSIRQSWPNFPRITADEEAIGVLYQAGLEEEASEYLEMLLSEAPQHPLLGTVLTIMGRFEEAIPHLERIPVIFLPQLTNSEVFGPHRDDPLFKELLETLNWTEEYEKALADIEKAKDLGG